MPQQVAEFLLLDRLIPALGAARPDRRPRSACEALAPSTERAGMADAARRPIGQARTRLEYADALTLLDELPVHLRALQRGLRRRQRRGHHPLLRPDACPVSWAHEGV